MKRMMVLMHVISGSRDLPQMTQISADRKQGMGIQGQAIPISGGA